MTSLNEIQQDIDNCSTLVDLYDFNIKIESYDLSNKLRYKTQLLIEDKRKILEHDQIIQAINQGPGNIKEILKSNVFDYFITFSFKYNHDFSLIKEYLYQMRRYISKQLSTRVDFFYLFVCKPRPHTHALLTFSPNHVPDPETLNALIKSYVNIVRNFSHDNNIPCITHVDCKIDLIQDNNHLSNVINYLFQPRNFDGFYNYFISRRLTKNFEKNQKECTDGQSICYNN